MNLFLTFLAFHPQSWTSDLRHSSSSYDSAHQRVSESDRRNGVSEPRSNSRHCDGFGRQLMTRPRGGREDDLSSWKGRDREVIPHFCSPAGTDPTPRRTEETRMQMKANAER